MGNLRQVKCQLPMDKKGSLVLEGEGIGGILGPACSLIGTVAINFDRQGSVATCQMKTVTLFKLPSYCLHLKTAERINICTS